MRIQAAQLDAGQAVNGQPSAYETARMQLAQHQRQLKDIQSVERKIELKRQILADYAPYVDGVLAAAPGTDDDVLATIMIWRIDAGDYPGGLLLAEYILTHGLPLPERHRRTPATLVTEEIAEASLRDTEAVDTDTLEQVAALVDDHDMPDEVRAKLHKALGIRYLVEDQLEAALRELKRALELHEGSGVKKKIEEVERAMRKTADPTDI